MFSIKRQDDDYVQVAATLDRQLSALNEAAAGPIRKQRVALTVSDDVGALIGGLSAEMFWNAIYVVSLWVREDHRGNGYGSRLLQTAEQAARDHGCDVSYLSTFEFQAPGFYEKQGYQTFGELIGVPAGSNRKWLRKTLS